MKPSAPQPVLVYSGWKPARRFTAAQHLHLSITLHQQLDGLQRGDPGSALAFAWAHEIITWARVAAGRGLGETELGPALALVFTLLARWAETGRAQLQGPQEYAAARQAVITIETLARIVPPGAVVEARAWAQPHTQAARDAAHTVARKAIAACPHS